MAEDRPNVFIRALDAVQNVIRPDYSLNREVQRAATLAIATEQRELIDFARNEAVDYLSKLAEIPQSERDRHLKLERIDPGETWQWRPEDWTDKAKLIAKVEADVEARAKDEKLDLATHDDRFAAYVGVGSAYGAAHLAVNFKEWEEDYWAAHDLAATDQHALGQQSEMWGDREKGADQDEAIRLENRIKRADWYADYSDDSRVRMRGAEENNQLAKELAEYAGRSPEHAAWISQSFDAHAPSDVGSFSGYVKEADRAPYGAFPASVEQQADTHPKLAGIGEVSQPREIADPKTVIEEARAARIDAALSDMADAVIAGERPRFRTEEQASAFMRDFETRYGAGAMERLRAGDSTDLARDEPDPSRVAIKGAALRMVAESHAVLRGQTQEQERPHIQTLDRESGHGLDL